MVDVEVYWAGSMGAHFVLAVMQSPIEHGLDSGLDSQQSAGSVSNDCETARICDRRTLTDSSIAHVSIPGAD